MAEEEEKRRVDARQKPTTSELLSKLFKTNSVACFIERYQGALVDQRFSDYLAALCDARGVVREHVIRLAGLERTYGHQIFRGVRNPSRDKVLQLAFGFQMDVPETQKLLRAANLAPLYPRVRRDAVLLHCISQKKDFLTTQGILNDMGLPCLGDDD
ncbi:MAG: hypothetical protein RSG50_05945 [Clostridia bacterium]